MLDDATENELLEFEFEDDDEVVSSKSTRRQDTNSQAGIDPKYEAKIELANEKVKKLEERLNQVNSFFSENEEIENFRKLEDEFSDVDDRTKLYNKRLIAKQNEKLAPILKNIKEEMESIKEAIKAEEVVRNQLQKELVTLNDTIILQNVAKKALEKELPDIVFVHPETKKKIGLGQTQVDQALKLYDSRYTNDPLFARKVDEVLRDPELTPTQKQNKIGKFIVSVFKEKIDEKLKAKKTSSQSEKSTDEGTKKAPEKTEPKATPTPEKKELTEEEKQDLEFKNREAIKRSLAKGKL